MFKLKGPGLNYVHGGLSLEEVIVPVIEVKSKKCGKNQRTVELQLIGSNNKITNYDTMLTFFKRKMFLRLFFHLKLQFILKMMMEIRFLMKLLSLQIKIVNILKTDNLKKNSH